MHVFHISSILAISVESVCTGNILHRNILLLGWIFLVSLIRSFMFSFIISAGSPFFRSLIPMAYTIVSFDSPPCLILPCASACKGFAFANRFVPQYFPSIYQVCGRISY